MPCYWYCTNWRFPEMGVPPNHPLIVWIFHERNHPFVGTPISGNHQWLTLSIPNQIHAANIHAAHLEGRLRCHSLRMGPLGKASQRGDNSHFTSPTSFYWDLLGYTLLRKTTWLWSSSAIAKALLDYQGLSKTLIGKNWYFCCVHCGEYLSNKNIDLTNTMDATNRNGT